MKKFSINKTVFGDEVYFENSEGKFLVCTVLYLQDQKKLEITYPFIQKKDIDIPIIADVSLEKDRNAKIVYHEITGNSSILNFEDIDSFKGLKIGKTPHKIKDVLGKGKKRYMEVYASCKSKNRTFYFSIRLDKENALNENKEILPDDYVDFFGITTSLYDPEYIEKEHEVFVPLQMIYGVKVYLNDIK